VFSECDERARLAELYADAWAAYTSAMKQHGFQGNIELVQGALDIARQQVEETRELLNNHISDHGCVVVSSEESSQDNP
jgi:hypothetical protein